MVTLDTQSPVPLYFQLAEQLAEDIRSGKYPVGSRIPSEPQLSRTYHIGRPTVRQATDVLVRQRRIERRRGSGTFVIDASEQLDVLSLAGTMKSMQKTGLAHKTTIVERLRRVSVDVCDASNPLRGSDAWFIRRLSKVQRSPLLLEALWLDTDCFPGLGKISLAGRSLSELAAEHYNMRAASADQSFRIIRADKKHAKWLDVKFNEPLLLVKRRVHFLHAKNAVYSELICKTDQLEFCQTIVAAEG